MTGCFQNRIFLVMKHNTICNYAYNISSRKVIEKYRKGVEKYRKELRENELNQFAFSTQQGFPVDRMPHESLLIPVI